MLKNSEFSWIIVKSVIFRIFEWKKRQIFGFFQEKFSKTPIFQAPPNLVTSEAREQVTFFFEDLKKKISINECLILLSTLENRWKNLVFDKKFTKNARKSLKPLIFLYFLLKPPFFKLKIQIFRIKIAGKPWKMQFFTPRKLKIQAFFH